MEKPEKGQIFSLDFMIAAGLAVLAIGMILNYYEMTAIAGKEARIKNEMTAVASVAATILIESNPCALNAVGAQNFNGQGYRLAGCATIAEPPAQGDTKAKLLIPETFKCYLKKNNTALAITGCQTQPPESEIDIVSIDRNFTVITGANLAKAAYDKCASAGVGCDATYSTAANWITVIVWK